MSNPLPGGGRHRHPRPATSLPKGAVVKQSGVSEQMMSLRGNGALLRFGGRRHGRHHGGQVVAGDVVVIRYEGPKGGPGMREMLAPTAAIMGLGLGDQCRPDHRRPLLRRDPRPLHRPHLARSGRGRPDRPGRGRRPDPPRHPGSASWSCWSTRRTLAARRRRGAPRSRRSRPAGWPATPRSSPRPTPARSVRLE